MKKRVTLLIPLTFNDGTEVPAESLQTIRTDLYQTFGGWTVAGIVEGAYQMQTTGEQQIDRLLHLWVVVEETQIDELKHMVSRWGKLLGQEAMYFEIAEGTIEFIPPSNGENTGNETKG